MLFVRHQVKMKNPEKKPRGFSCYIHISDTTQQSKVDFDIHPSHTNLGVMDLKP